MSKSLCSDSRYNPDIWHDDDKKQQARAIAICKRCPVVDECLRYSLIHRIPDGIWGGYRANYRRSMRFANREFMVDNCRPIIIDWRKNIDSTIGTNIWNISEDKNSEVSIV